MGPAEALAIMTIAISVATAIIFRGPMGRAIAERVAGKALRDDGVPGAEIERLHGELEEMKHRLDEAEDRLDFTERLLARQRQESGLGPGK